jgi:hypothetical protein
VVLFVSGSGIQSTQRFAVSDVWNVEYSYLCPNFGHPGSFEVAVYDGNEHLVDRPINARGSSGSAVAHEHTGAETGVYLAVNSECDWQVRVVAA